MKWKTLEPKIGDEKTEVRFAFFPIYTDNGYTLWLERYKVHLRYETQRVATKGGYIPRTRWFVVSTEIYTRQSTTRHVDSSNTIREYDNNGNLIHHRTSDGYAWWREYDANGKVIHYRDSNGREKWNEYDEHGKLIHYRYSDGFAGWYEYDTNGKLINTRTNND
jgi:YD repeat-containing protein